MKNRLIVVLLIIASAFPQALFAQSLEGIIHPKIISKNIVEDGGDFIVESQDRSVLLQYNVHGTYPHLGKLSRWVSLQGKGNTPLFEINDIRVLGINGNRAIVGCITQEELTHDCRLVLRTASEDKAIDTNTPADRQNYYVDSDVSVLNNQNQFIWRQSYREKPESLDDRQQLMFFDGHNTIELFHTRSFAELGGAFYEDISDQVVSLDQNGNVAATLAVTLYNVDTDGSHGEIFSTRTVHIVRTKDGGSITPHLDSAVKIVEIIQNNGIPVLVVTDGKQLAVKSLQGDDVVLSSPLKDDRRIVRILKNKRRLVKGSLDRRISPHGYFNLKASLRYHPFNAESRLADQSLTCAIVNKDHHAIESVSDILPNGNLLVTVVGVGDKSSGGTGIVKLPFSKPENLCTNIKIETEKKCKSYFYNDGWSFSGYVPRTSPFSCGFTITVRNAAGNILHDVNLHKEKYRTDGPSVQSMQLDMSKISLSSTFHPDPFCGADPLRIVLPYNDPLYHSSEVLIGWEHCA